MGLRIASSLCLWRQILALAARLLGAMHFRPAWPLDIRWKISDPSETEKDIAPSSGPSVGTIIALHRAANDQRSCTAPHG